MRKNGKLCDIEIKFIDQDRTISAHRVILAGTIPYFYKTICPANSENGKKTKIILEKFDADVIESLIDYCYSGKIDLKIQNIENLLICADIFELTDVKEACVKFMIANLQISNVIRFRRFCETIKCQDLNTATIYYIREKFSEIATSPFFLELNSKELLEILGSDELNVSCEQDVYEAVMRWVKHNEEERKIDLPEILQKVRLTLLSLPYLMEVVSGENSIRKSLDCRDILDEAKLFLLNYTTDDWKPKFCNLLPRNYKKHELYMVCGSNLGPINPLVDTIMLFKDNQWLTVTKLPKPKQWFGCTIMNGKIYVVGGRAGEERSSSVEIFDLQTKEWSEGVNMIEKKRSLGVATLNNCIYVCGGGSNGKVSNTAECFSESSNQWKRIAPLNEYRQMFDAVSLNGFVYAVGGWNGEKPLNSCERYSPTENKWKFVKPMQVARERLRVATINGKIYVCGGRDSSDQYLKNCEAYDPETDCWSFITPMLRKRSDFALTSCNGKIYAIGGWNEGGFITSSAEEFCPEKDEWKFITALPFACDGVAVTSHT